MDNPAINAISTFNFIFSIFNDLKNKKQNNAKKNALVV